MKTKISLLFSTILFIQLHFAQQPFSNGSSPRAIFTDSDEYYFAINKNFDTKKTQVNKISIATGQVLQTTFIDCDLYRTNIFGEGQYIMFKGYNKEIPKIFNISSGYPVNMEEMQKSKILGLTKDEKNVVFYREWNNEVGMVDIYTKKWQTIKEVNSKDVELSDDGKTLFYLKGGKVIGYDLETKQEFKTGIKADDIAHAKSKKAIKIAKSPLYTCWNAETGQFISGTDVAIDRNCTYYIQDINKNNEFVSLSDNTTITLEKAEGCSVFINDGETASFKVKDGKMWFHVFENDRSNKGGNAYLAVYDLKTFKLIDKYKITQSLDESNALAAANKKAEEEKLKKINDNLSPNFKQFLANFDLLPSGYSMTIQNVKGRDITNDAYAIRLRTPSEKIYALGKIAECGEKVVLLAMISGAGKQPESTFDYDNFVIITINKKTEKEEPYIYLGQIRLLHKYNGHSQGVSLNLKRDSSNATIKAETFSVALPSGDKKVENKTYQISTENCNVSKK